MAENYVSEGKARIKISESVFYNPNMRLNRDLSSLVVGAINEIYEIPLILCDGMAASGIRGIRYKLENKVEKITFVDGDPIACENINENIKINNINDAIVVNDDINHHLYRGGIKYNFIELDPFGSPVPFIRAALLNIRGSKKGFLSVTATDTAVLCGTHSKACIISYGSKPLRGPICHEVGIRILLSNIVKNAAPLHLGIKPLFSISKRHYMKTIVAIEKSADSAYNSMEKLGFVSFCPKCGNIKTYSKPKVENNCSYCNSNIDWGGDLWLGELYDQKIITEMIRLNENREYEGKKEIDSLLSLIYDESTLPPFYYDLHYLADKYRVPSPRFDEVMYNLRSNGFSVSRTHFNATAIKTDAKLEDVLESMKIKNRL